MNFFKLVYEEWKSNGVMHGSYSYRGASDLKMDIIGRFLVSDVRCNNTHFRAWSLADKEDVNGIYSYNIGGNVTDLEEENNEILMRDSYSEEEIPTVVKMSRKQFVQLLDDWNEKVCKVKPKEVVIKYENGEYSIETHEGVLDEYPTVKKEVVIKSEG
jgi:hypothetical protein